MNGSKKKMEGVVHRVRRSHASPVGRAEVIQDFLGLSIMISSDMKHYTPLEGLSNDTYLIRKDGVKENTKNATSNSKLNDRCCVCEVKVGKMKN